MKLEIEKCVYGGAGLARAEGKTIFVPFTLPGEIVEARIVEDKKSFASAELNDVLKPANERVNPPCEYFKQCGGCQYQHAAHTYQTDLKVNILRETLERARLATLPEIVPVHAGPLAYRNRVRLHVQREPLALCYRQRSSHANLPVRSCPIAAPLIEQAMEAVMHVGHDLVAGCDEIEFFTNESQSELLLSLWIDRVTGNPAARLEEFCANLQGELPVLAGAAVFSSQGARFAESKVAEWGEQKIAYRAAGFAFRVSAGSFFQVNRFLVDRLAELVSAGLSGGLAWDLYAGVGLFAQPLSQRFDKVVAVEAAPSSSNDLRHNLSGASHKTVRSGTLEFLRQHRGPAPDLIVVDPPRAGLGNGVVSILTKVRPQTIVYVSCDPATLARDLRALVESGYRLSTMHMVDLFPQTFHLESVTVLSLR